MNLLKDIQCWWTHTVKANSHIACRVHAVPLPCRAAKSLECAFPHLIYTVRPCLIHTCHALPMPCSDHAVLLKATHSTSVERRPVDYLPAFGFFRLPRGVRRRLLSKAYQSQMQVASVKPNNVCHGRGKDW